MSWRSEPPRLCIPIEIKPEGGMYTFVGNFTRWLDRHGLAYTADPAQDFDVLFVNSWVIKPSAVRRIKRAKPRIRVVQRVDGSAADYGGNPQSDRVQARVNLLADRTIFQSEYSRYSTREKRRVVVNDGPVIYNPVDVAQFSPAGSRLHLPSGRPRVMCASWSTNRRKGTWQIDRLAAAHPDVLFVLSGRFEIGAHENVVNLGHLGREAIAEAFRSCDVFLNLSENDPCPNVVIEALASGLPVLYRDSGGVPELVGDCGLPVEVETFADSLAQVINDRARLGGLARERAVSRFSAEVIFPEYMQAFAGIARTPMPSAFTILRLAREGYPVLPSSPSAHHILGALGRRAPALARRLGGRGAGKVGRVGWITPDSFPRKKRHFRELEPFARMRAGNLASWMNARQDEFVNELYVPGRRYEAVVVQKTMDGRCQEEARKIQAYGGKIVFDANVNYYQVWGDYIVPGTQPTEQQRKDALYMTTMADWVVADSTYLANVISALTPRVGWIPDNIDLSVYDASLRLPRDGGFRMVWSGVGKKAAHLLLIKDVLATLQNAELILVVDESPACLPQLREAIPCSVLPFSDEGYAKILATCDVIISPKCLVNAYEMAHTEYKITLGMAMGLPAVASPQQSYVEAIDHRGGGIIAGNPGEWQSALERLRGDPELRADLGSRARQTVAERYSTQVVGGQYLELLRTLMVKPNQLSV